MARKITRSLPSKALPLLIMVVLATSGCSGSGPATTSAAASSGPTSTNAVEVETSPSGQAETDSGGGQMTRPVKLRQPSHVRAGSTYDTQVRIEWESENKGVRGFEILDNRRRVGGRLNARKRHVVISTSYGTHCFRVVAIGENHFLDSSPSSCGTVTVSEPPPPEPAESQGGLYSCAPYPGLGDFNGSCD